MRKEAVIASLSTSIPQLFHEAQKPNVNQRTHAITLYTLHQQCALTEGDDDQFGSIDFEGEAAFHKEFIRNVNKVLPIRKKEPHADRVVRFVAHFMQYSQQKEAAHANEDTEDTLLSRFVEMLMHHMLRGVNAKSKTVRFRCCQFVALSINSLGEIDEDLYQAVRQALFEKIRDKEPSVRSQAATALSRLQDGDGERDESDGKTITQKLVWMLKHDPSPEVRRAVLLNLEKNSETIPSIVERARDVDAINRRVVFYKPMSDIPDFELLSTHQRHKLLKWGLNDRDPLVKRVATRMIATKWIEHASNNLLEFLERMNVAEGEAAEDVLTAFLGARPETINNIKFDDQFWDNLSPESAFLARVFINFLQSKKYDEKLDTVLPEVTRHAFILQHYSQQWQQAPKDTIGAYEFIVAQLLGIAKCLDYADEVGRRKMFVLLRQILMLPDIQDDHIASIVELFKIILIDEQDFTRTIIEIISDIEELVTESTDQSNDGGHSKRLRRMDDSQSQDDDDDEEEEKEQQRMNDELLKKKLSQLKCLTICKYMLEQCKESLPDNSTIYGLLNDLIVPSVQSKEVVLREEGLHCLGLCCHLDKSLALHNIPMLTHCLSSGHEQLQQKALLVICDILMSYGLKAVLTKMKDLSQIRDLFELCLDHDNSEIQAVAAEGLAKLMLSKIFRDEEMLKLLVLLYFFPSTIDNAKVQQCLTYFFPAYCYSSAENQKLMAKVAIPALEELCSTYIDLEKDEEMVPPSQIADMLADWTDPRKVATTHIRKVQDQQVDKSIHADMAIEALQIICRESGHTRKTMCHILSKLYVTEAENDRFRDILDQCKRINETKPIKEVLIRNHFLRFVGSIEKLYKPLTESAPAPQEDDTISGRDNLETPEEPSNDKEGVKEEEEEEEEEEEAVEEAVEEAIEEVDEDETSMQSS